MGPGPAGVPGKAPGWGGDFAVSQRGSHGEPDFGRFGAEGTTTIYHAAREPEIGDLIGFLTAGGARIYGAGTSMLQIEGGFPDAAVYTVLPDRMEAATFLGCHRFGGRRPVPGADAAWGLCTGDRGSAGCGLPDAEGPGDPHSGPGAAAKRVAHSHCAPIPGFPPMPKRR